MGGRGSAFIAKIGTLGAALCCAVCGEAAPCVLPATWRSYLPRGPSSESSIFAPVQFFYLIFGAAFGGFLMLKMGHAAYRWKAHEVYFPTIYGSQESDFGRKSYGSRKLGCLSYFFAFFWQRFWPNGRSHRRTESCVSQLELQSFLRTRAHRLNHSEPGGIRSRRRLSKRKNASDFQRVFLIFCLFMRTW
jgi:hypothetical protein